ncbi:hypothetical protein GQ54DRAFT_306622 [Martensiomyces pterosporus]|nr:hypothetical protein GQ54DRAFT_306622 [Martensiomyces pterosporus]
MSRSFTLVKEFKIVGSCTAVYPGIYEQVVDAGALPTCTIRTSGRDMTILAGPGNGECLLSGHLDGPRKSRVVFIALGSTTTASLDANSGTLWSFDDFDGARYTWLDGMFEMSWKLEDPLGNQIANFQALSDSRKIEGVLVVLARVSEPMLMLILATAKLVLKSAQAASSK